MSQSFVYLVMEKSHGNNRYAKVGFTSRTQGIETGKCLAKRLANLQTGNPSELEYKTVCEQQDAKSCEKEVQDKLQDLRERGEWFHYLGNEKRIGGTLMRVAKKHNGCKGLTPKELRAVKQHLMVFLDEKGITIPNAKPKTGKQPKKKMSKAEKQTPTTSTPKKKTVAPETLFRPTHSMTLQNNNPRQASNPSFSPFSSGPSVWDALPPTNSMTRQNNNSRRGMVSNPSFSPFSSGPSVRDTLPPKYDTSK